MSDTCILGLDPGKKGGMAWMVPSDRRTARAIKFPDTEAEIMAAVRHVCDNHDDVFAYIEQVASGMHAKREGRSMGASSAFTFGRGYGFLRGCLFGACIPFEEVSPRKWQAALSCLTGGDKNISKQKAGQLFPWLKVTHATADALLICEYGCRLLRPTAATRLEENR